MRTAVAKVSGTGMKEALDRSSAVWAFGAGAVDAGGVAPVKLTELAAYGMHAKAPKIAQLKGTRRVATLLATMRHLEGVSVDDALLLFELLMTTKLLARAGRDEKDVKLKSLPRLRKAALQAESALRAALDTPMTQADQPARDEAEAAGAEPVARVTTAQEMIARIASVVPIAQLEAALAVIREFLPAEEDDADLAWRAELTSRFASVRGFVELLAETIPWGGTDAGTPVIAALRGLPRVLAYGKHAGTQHIEAHKDLVSGSWRRLVYGSPGLGDGQIDRHAYTFCVLEALWSALRSKDVYAVGADKSGDPRAKLIPDALWSVHSASILTALGLDADPGTHLRKLAGDLGEVYRELAGSLDANPAITIKGGRLNLAKLEAAPLPEAYQAAHDAVMKMLPRIDYPELLLEVHGHTGMFDAFGHISGSTSRRADLDISLAALMVARSCNLGLGPVVKADDPALGQHRLTGVEKGYFHHEGMGAASGKLIEAQARIDIAREDWGGGLVASADGLRFVVPVRSLYGRPNPHYFGQSRRSKGATWLAVVSDRVMGLGGLLVPGTMRDSLFILDALHRLDAREQPEILTTDTASYSDIVFGLFAICGYQFAPRIADISDAQQWWIDPADVGLADKRTTPSAAGYGRLAELNLRRVNIAAIRQHWPQMLQVAGSLITGKVRAYDLIRMMTADGRTTGLGHAFAHYGRIFKSMHLLHVAHLEDYRRMMGAQLNVGEGRNGLARAVFFANLGQLRRGYERGMEDQLGALGLGLNAIVYWNSLYIDAAVKKLEAGGMRISPEIRAHLSPLQWEHINFHGTYLFNRPELPGRLRDLRDPTADDDQEL
jgi:TnpA family transposase